MKNCYKYTLLPVCVLFAVAACTPDTECRTEETVHCGVVFQCDSTVTTSDTTYSVTFNTIDSLTLTGVDNDSVLYDNQKSVTAIALPLRKNAEETRFNLTVNGRQDVLVVRHRNRDYFISLACGCFVYHDIDTAYTEGKLVKDTEILNTAVENTQQDNIRLYIHL